MIIVIIWSHLSSPHYLFFLFFSVFILFIIIILYINNLSVSYLIYIYFFVLLLLSRRVVSHRPQQHTRLFRAQKMHQQETDKIKRGKQFSRNFFLFIFVDYISPLASPPGVGLLHDLDPEQNHNCIYG